MKPIKLVMNAFGSFLEKTEIDFTVLNNAGFYLITGATGSGKTTILSLLVRNYDIQKGQILIDDVDLKELSIEEIRKAML